MNKFPKAATAILVVLSILLADQVLKIWVKTHMHLGDCYDITSWFKIYFVENNGMAFGVEVIGKLFLSIFRIIAVGFIGYYLYTLVQKKYSNGYITCVSLVLAGALGNILDSIFYGVLFTESTPLNIAQKVSIGDGYAGFLHGKVVDMLYFPIINTTYPSGEPFIFFSPIFNLADSAISVGIVLLLLFYRKTLSQSLHEPKLKHEPKNEE